MTADTPSRHANLAGESRAGEGWETDYTLVWEEPHYAAQQPDPEDIGIKTAESR